MNWKFYALCCHFGRSTFQSLCWYQRLVSRTNWLHCETDERNGCFCNICRQIEKAVIQSFQNCPPGVSPVEIVGARLQISNKASSFTNETFEAALKTATRQIFFTNFAVDVCWLKALILWQQFEFLAWQSTISWNSWKKTGSSYLWIMCSPIREYFVDCDLLQQANVPIDWYRVGEFASCKLSATLFSYHTLQKVGNGIEYGIVFRLVGSLSSLLTFFNDDIAFACC